MRYETMVMIAAGAALFCVGMYIGAWVMNACVDRWLRDHGVECDDADGQG